MLYKYKINVIIPIHGLGVSWIISGTPLFFTCYILLLRYVLALHPDQS